MSWNERVAVHITRITWSKLLHRNWGQEVNSWAKCVPVRISSAISGYSRIYWNNVLDLWPTWTAIGSKDRDRKHTLGAHVHALPGVFFGSGRNVVRNQFMISGLERFVVSILFSKPLSTFGLYVRCCKEALELKEQSWPDQSKFACWSKWVTGQRFYCWLVVCKESTIKFKINLDWSIRERNWKPYPGRVRVEAPDK